MDERIKAGMLAVSKAGRDLGTLYLIVKADSRFVWLADGRYKTRNSPKKKNRHHIQVIKKECVSDPNALTDVEIKRLLKIYRKSE